MTEELRSHLDGLIERNLAAGLSPEAARHTALRSFGDVAQVAERCRDERRSAWGEQLLQDLHYGLRTLRKDLRFAFVAVATLALGIGANTAVFSVLHALLLRPLPYPQSDRLVVVSESHLERGERSAVSAGNYLEWREQNAVFADLAAYGSFGANLKSEGPPQPSRGARITPNLPGLLGVRPLLGPGFTGEGRAMAASREILVSHAVWQARFGGRMDIAGMRVELNEEAAVIVGVMPAGFEFPARELDFWLAQNFDAEDRESRRTREWRVLGRLKPGVGMEAAQVAMTELSGRIALAQPQFMAGWGVKVAPYRQEIVRHVRPTLLILAGVVALVLLVACTNVANLMLARAAVRQRELAIRGALGASRGRLVRQLLTEALLLAGLGAVAGVMLAAWSMDFLAALAPEGLPGLAQPAIDAAALGFAAGALVFATVIVGLIPAWWLSRRELRVSLQGGRSESGGFLLRRARTVLLVVQLALATILLVGAGLLLRTMHNLQRVDLGFDPDRLLAATVDLPDSRYKTVAEQAVAYERLRARLEGVARIERFAGTSDPPLASSSTFSFVVAGRPRLGPNPRENPVEVRNVTPGYFQTMRLPVLAGRDFTTFDRAGTSTVAVVNRAFAREHFSGGQAVGQRISFTGHAGPWIEIVGLAEDVRDAGPELAAAPAIYLPYAQKRVLWQSTLSVVLRTAGEPAQLADEIRAAFAAVDAELPRPRVVTIAGLYQARLAQRDFITRLLGGFALLALCLGAVGIYGLVSYSVGQRQREFGIRLALGARRQDIVARVLRDGLTPVGLGVIFGAAGALALSRFLDALLFEIQSSDTFTFAAVLALLLLISLLALWFPALRASRIDPGEALRAE